MGRDVHSLAVLFIMPVAFILIMSLAMRDLFDTHGANQIKILVVNQDKGAPSIAYIKTLENLKTFSFHHMADGTGNIAMGAPNLTDDVWLYGGSLRAIKESLIKGRNGVMPAHKEFLGEAKIHILTAYVYSLSQ